MTDPTLFDDSYLSVCRHDFTLEQTAKILNHEYPPEDHVDVARLWKTCYSDDDTSWIPLTAVAKHYQEQRGVTGAELSERLKKALVDECEPSDICYALVLCIRDNYLDESLATTRWWADLLCRQLERYPDNDEETTAYQLVHALDHIYDDYYYYGENVPISFQKALARMLVAKIETTPEKPPEKVDPTLFDEFDEAQTDYVVVRCLKKLIRIEEHHLGRGEVSVGGVVVEHGSTWPLNDEWSRIGTQVVLKASKAKESAGVVLGDEAESCFYVTLRAPHILHVSAYCCASGGDE